MVFWLFMNLVLFGINRRVFLGELSLSSIFKFCLGKRGVLKGLIKLIMVVGRFGKF